MKTIIMTTLNIITNNTIITANAPSTLPTSSRTSLPPPIQSSLNHHYENHHHDHSQYNHQQYNHHHQCHHQLYQQHHERRCLHQYNHLYIITNNTIITTNVTINSTTIITNVAASTNTIISKPAL